jgi:hypothetical protein
VDENYGALYIHTTENKMTASLKNIRGEIVRSLLVED